MPTTGGDVLLDHGHDGQVAYLTLTHGGYTIVTMEMRAKMAQRFAEIDRDPNVRAVVVRSDGKHFTSGGDIAGFMEVDPIDLTDLGHDITIPSRGAVGASTSQPGRCQRQRRVRAADAREPVGAVSTPPITAAL